MSDILRLCMQDLSNGLDFTQGEPRSIHYETLVEMLFKIFSDEKKIDTETLASAAAEHGWTRLNIFFMKEIAFSIEKNGCPPLSVGKGYGTLIVNNAKKAVLLEKMRASTQKMLESIAESVRELDSIEEGEKELETLTAETDGPAQTKMPNQEDETNLVPLLVIIAIIAVLFALIKFSAPAGSSLYEHRPYYE